MKYPYPCLLLLLIICSFHFSKPDLSSDRAALLALRSSIGGRTLLWDVSQQSPCNWAGVLCEQNRVAVLRLPGVSLSGDIPVGILGNLTSLRTLSLRINSLTGNLPADLANCANLRNVYLQGNHFSGEIPGFLFGLHDLVRLNLASNNFSGEISRGYNNLTRLKTLFLENNQLSGFIPDLDLPSLQELNVSNNLLNGSIPKGFQSFGSSAFLGNSLCGVPLKDCAAKASIVVPSSPTGEIGGNGDIKIGKRKKLSGGAVAGIVIGSLLGFLLILLILMILCRKKSKKNTKSVDIISFKRQEVEIPGDKPVGEAENGGYGNGFSVAAAAAAAMTGNGNGKGEVNNNGANKLVFMGNTARVFDLEDLLRASAEVLGKGTFGTSYKAVIEIGTTVAVKRLKDVTITDREFKEKIEGVGAMDHENLVPLRAYYYSGDEKLLVYDYMAMGSLSALLHGNKGASKTPLNWELRSGIALGAARGIEYLHSQGTPNVSHGNIKSSNILLTKSYEARVSDFGLAHLVGPASAPNCVVGYRAPEVTDPRKVSQKADVYSFGVLLLELLTGKAPNHALLNEEGVDLPRWVQSIVKEEWTSEVFDLELLRYHNVEEMVQLLQLAIDCAAQYPDNRPSMSEVTRRVEEICRSSIIEYHDLQPDQVLDADDTSSR